MRYYLVFLLLFPASIFAQLKWQNVDSLYQPLPKSVHVYFTNNKIDSGAFRAYYVVADIKDKNLNFTADTSSNRRLTPAQFYLKENKALIVVNSSFFSFDKNKSLSLVIKDGKLIAYN